MMKTRLLLALFATVTMSVSSGFAAETASAEAAYKDIEATIGVVPSHFKRYPQSAVAGAWEMTKGLLMPRPTRSSPRRNR